MHKSSLIAEWAVSSDKNLLIFSLRYISCDGGSKDLYAESVGNNFLCFFVQIWVDEGYVIVTNNAISKSWQFLFNAFNLKILLSFYTLTDSGREFLMLLSSVSEQVLGTRRPFLLPWVSLPTILVPPMVQWMTGTTDPSSDSKTL